LRRIWGTGGAGRTSRLAARDGGRECPGASTRHSSASLARALFRPPLQPDLRRSPRLPLPLEFAGLSHRLPRQGLPSGHSLLASSSSSPTGQPRRSARRRGARGPAVEMTLAATATTPGNPDIDRPGTNSVARPTAAPPGAAGSHNVYKSSWPPPPFSQQDLCVHLISLPVLGQPAVEGWRGGGVGCCDPIGIASRLARLDAQAQSPYHTPSPDDWGEDGWFHGRKERGLLPRLLF
jgi:hypothetical protein